MNWHTLLLFMDTTMLTYNIDRNFWEHTVADTPPSQVPCNIQWKWVETNQKEEGINPMFDISECAPCAPTPMKLRVTGANAQVINAVPVEATQRDYAIALIKKIGEEHAQVLRKQFHIDGDRPRTAQQLIDAIKNDQFTLDQGKLAANAEEIQLGYYNNEFGIVWGPAPDAKGWTAAKDVLKDAAQTALTKATLNTIDKLEGVIEDFKAWTLPTA